MDIRPVARRVGGVGRPPPPSCPSQRFCSIAILFHPLAILFHPLAILFHPLAILFHPLAILFHPLAILFHPWNMWMTSHGQCPRGGACECPRGVCFPIFRRADDVTRTMSKGGWCAWCSTHPSSDPPPTWLAGYGPGYCCTREYQ